MNQMSLLNMICEELLNTYLLFSWCLCTDKCTPDCGYAHHEIMHTSANYNMNTGVVKTVIGKVVSRLRSSIA